MFSYKLVCTCFDSCAKNHVSRLFTLNKAEAAKKKKVFYSCLKGCKYILDVYFCIGVYIMMDTIQLCISLFFLGIYSGKENIVRDRLFLHQHIC